MIKELLKKTGQHMGKGPETEGSINYFIFTIKIIKEIRGSKLTFPILDDPYTFSDILREYRIDGLK